MRIYSDTLTLGEIREATNAAPGCYLVNVETIANPRVRRQGWKLNLASVHSNRHPNSGQYGAKTWAMYSPASWDEHGAWMAEVFDRDPTARIAEYDGRDHFHRQTDYRYRKVPA